MTIPIQVNGLGKYFRLPDPNRPHTLKESLLRGLRYRGSTEHFWALRDVSFEVNAGTMLGVIGANGAGKSTLLRLLGGVGKADEGRIQANGRIGALLDLGADFHPDLTGRENVFTNGVISGLTKRQVTERFEAIVRFAELEAFIDNPLRTYSSGMQMRLAFAVAAHIDPEILIIDEVLAVGDIAFQQKCLERIARFKERGCAIVLVSHDPNLVKTLCDEAIWLRKGRIVGQGSAAMVVEQYVAEMDSESRRRTPRAHPVAETGSGAELRVLENRFGSLEMEITAVHLLDVQGRPTAEIHSGSALRVQIAYDAPRPLPPPIFSVTISRQDGLICYDINNTINGPTFPPLVGRGLVELSLERLDLVGGDYYVDVGVYEQAWAYAYDYHWHVYPLTIAPTKVEKGVLHLPHRWHIQTVPANTNGLDHAFNNDVKTVSSGGVKL